MSEFNVSFYETKPYELPMASTDTLGGVKIGNNMSIDGEGYLTANTAEAIKIGIGVIGIGETQTTVDFDGTIIGVTAFEGNEMINKLMHFTIDNGQLICTVGEPAVEEITCTVIYV